MRDGKLTVWASGCAHVSADKKQGRDSIGDAMAQLDADGVKWDVGVNVGDFSAAFGLPTEEEGAEIVRQMSSSTKHPREHVYSICGNHDRNAPHEPSGMWFQKWIDPMGSHTETSNIHRHKYPYPVHGDWDRYYFDVGNIRFLMMSDVNPTGRKLGRGELGGDPGGAVSQATFDWWVDQVESNYQDKIIVSVHHYLLRETTVATGDWEGMMRDEDECWRTNYHGYYANGQPNAASYMAYVGEDFCKQNFEKWLQDNPGKVDLWLGGHTHTNPDDVVGGKSHIETAYGGTHFINVAALTRWFVKMHARPHSRLLDFEDGSDELTVGCYMHNDDYRPQGFYHEKQTRLKLSKAFINA